MNLQSRIRTVFSVLYNESDEFLLNYLRNFLNNTDNNDYLIVNLDSQRKINFTSVDCRDRVFIMNGDIARDKIGHTLLLGHLESFDFALSVLLNFDYFCTLASNSLFVREFNIDAAILALSSRVRSANIEFDDPPDRWWWPTVRKTPVIVDYLRREWGLKWGARGQIEGLFASKTDWEILHTRFSRILDLGNLIEPAERFPFEEILPHTFFRTVGSGQYINICHNFWDRAPPVEGKDFRLVDIRDLLELSIYPQHIFVMKWFDRDNFSTEVIAVTDAWARDLISSVSDILATRNMARMRSQRILLEELAAAIRGRENSMPTGESSNLFSTDG